MLRENCLAKMVRPIHVVMSGLATYEVVVALALQD